MTEFEINKKVADKLGLCITDYFKMLDSDYSGSEIDVCDRSGDYHTYSFDPCNNIEQAWDIMMRYNICVTKDGDGYTAVRDLKYMDNNEFSSEFNDPVYHNSPLVSAMLCFLEIDK